MALSAGESYSGGQVRDTQSRSVVISETTDAAVTAGEFYSGGFLCDPDSRTVICQDTVHSALTANEQYTSGDVRDKVGRLVCATETLNSAISAGSQFSGGWLRDSKGRRIIALDTLGSALSAGEQFTAGQVRDSAGRLVLATESGPPFDPTTIPGLVGWWKADSLALADGTAVSSWADSSSNGWTATQATGANQPIFHTGKQHGLPALTFNGTTHTLTTAIAGVVQPLTLFAVSKSTLAGIGDVLGSASGCVIEYNAQAPMVRAGGVAMTGGSAAGLFVYTTYVLNGSSASSFINLGGVQVATGNSGGPSPGTSGLGGTITIGSGAAFWAGDIGEILLYSTAVSAPNITTVEAYLKAKWGL